MLQTNCALSRKYKLNLVHLLFYSNLTKPIKMNYFDTLKNYFRSYLFILWSSLANFGNFCTIFASFVWNKKCCVFLIICFFLPHFYFQQIYVRHHYKNFVRNNRYRQINLILLVSKSSFLFKNK